MGTFTVPSVYQPAIAVLCPLGCSHQDKKKEMISCDAVGSIGQTQ